MTLDGTCGEFLPVKPEDYSLPPHMDSRKNVREGPGGWVRFAPSRSALIPRVTQNPIEQH